MKIQVRELDSDRLLELASRVGMGTATAEAFIVRQEQLEGVLLGAYTDGTPVGYVFLKWNPDLPGDYVLQMSGAFGDLENMFVIERWRSKGIGSSLISKAEQIAGSKGCRLLGLAVDPERNPRAHKLYQRRGFKDVGLPPFDTSGSWTDSDGGAHSYEEWCIYMTKRL